jgi:Ca2+-binding EF-hand superfamily protein
MRLLLPALLCIGVIGCGGADTASTRRAEPPPAFAHADHDGDGAVTAAEWDGVGNAFFDAVDRDGSGFLEPDEMRDGFDTVDVDGDRAITPAEAGEVVYRWDADDDGRVSEDEFRAIDWSKTRLDLNGDGKISEEELRRERRAHFSAADRDRDGLFTRAELRAGTPQFTLFRF